MLVALLLVVHFALAAALIYGLDLLAFAPWLRAKDAHWTERARLLWPARVAGGLWFYALPFFLAAAQSILFPELPGIYLLTALAGFPGGILGGWPMGRAMFPQLRFTNWLVEFVVGTAIRFLRQGALIAAGFFMPAELEWSTLAITAAVVAFIFWLVYGGLFRLLRTLHYFKPAPPRLTAIVNETAARMRMPTPPVLVIRGLRANAFAALTIHTLGFTEGALSALNDEELSSLCAHELAHLTEPPEVVRARVLSAFTIVPLILIRPAIEAFGFFGFLFLAIGVYVARMAVRDFAHRMEKRADAMAKAHEGESAGAYARALERLYQFNHAPAVLGGRNTHPDLYDRLLAAGVTPDYPRPRAPEAPTNTYWLLGILAMMTIFTLFFRIDDEIKMWKSNHRHARMAGDGMRGQR
jgi:Zn-dependent protease with chaperone function